MQADGRGGGRSNIRRQKNSVDLFRYTPFTSHPLQRRGKSRPDPSSIVPKFLLPRKSLPQLPPPPFSGSRYDATCLDYSQASFYLLILPSQIYGFHPLSLGDILLKKTPGARSCSLLYQCSFLPRRFFLHKKL
jgi:hypothetical protein